MKKKAFLILVSLLLLGAVALSGCGGNTSEPAPQTTTPPAGGNTDTGTQVTGTDKQGDTAEKPTLGFIPAKDPTAVPAAAKARTDTIIIGMNATEGVFNPLYGSSQYDVYVMDTLFQFLVKPDKDATLIPDLAKWDVSADGKTYTFHIDPNATFSDGTPVTAEDLAFSYYIIGDPTFDGVADLTTAGIVGYDEYKNDKAGKVTTISGVKVVDEKTLEVTVKEPKGTTLFEINVPALSKKYYGKGFKKGDLSGITALHQKPMGSGPYVLKKYTPGQEVVMEANPNFWEGAPKVKNIIFKATTEETNIQLLQNGETDFEEGISVNKDNMELLDTIPFLNRSLLLNNGYGYIGMNHKLDKFKDKRVRKALAYGLNREEAVFAYSQGFANVIDVPESKVSWAYPDEKDIIHYNYDPEKAKQLLDEAGWKVGDDGFRYKDGQKFTITFTATTPNPVNEALVPIMKENYKELGIDLVVEQLDFNAVTNKVDKGDIEMYFLAWGLTVDPDNYSVFHSKGTQNTLGYSNPEVDRLIIEGQKALKQEDRKKIYQELYKVLNDDLPYIFLYQRYNMNTFNARLTGFDISPYKDFSRSLHQVTIQNQ
ncbi:Extracellular solute-binding protein family 5 [[Clostridium] ultunense Esp]|uniref:ABC transporter substrate-binding protein n=1 Tax=Thermicanus aegyptius TaxID=94009 RepID=UPI0002B6F3BE|nr:ABC transporter substrate-binding protein [Thermicanus aegyptius]CCQ96576.1 Extracellular solute-binding protein family 5 [[Clostridium] ultunense Esp]